MKKFTVEIEDDVLEELRNILSDQLDCPLEEVFNDQIIEEMFYVSVGRFNYKDYRDKVRVNEVNS